jgi:type I restriction enzyme R subunit
VRKNSPETLGFARDQRRQPTRAEAAFWQAVRSRRFHGLKFKRQMAIGPFIDAFLRREGYRVLRFPNERVLGNLDFVLREIADVLGLAELPSSDPASPGHLLPRGEKE